MGLVVIFQYGLMMVGHGFKILEGSQRSQLEFLIPYLD